MPMREKAMPKRFLRYIRVCLTSLVSYDIAFPGADSKYFVRLDEDYVNQAPFVVSQPIKGARQIEDLSL